MRRARHPPLRRREGAYPRGLSRSPGGPPTIIKSEVKWKAVVRGGPGEGINVVDCPGIVIDGFDVSGARGDAHGRDLEHATPHHPGGRRQREDHADGDGAEHRLAQHHSAYEVLRFQRPVLKRKDSGAVSTTPAAFNVLDNSIADVSFLAGLLVDKFLYHLPLYRQHQRLLAAGVDVSRQWLTNQVLAVALLGSLVVVAAVRRDLHLSFRPSLARLRCSFALIVPDGEPVNCSSSAIVKPSISRNATRAAESLSSRFIAMRIRVMRISRSNISSRFRRR